MGFNADPDSAFYCLNAYPALAIEVTFYVSFSLSHLFNFFLRRKVSKVPQ